MTTQQIPKIKVFSKGYCPYCKTAKATLRRLGLDFEEIDIAKDANSEREMLRLSQRRTVPQIFIDSHHVGGNDELQRILRNGELDQILQASAAVA